MIVGDVPEWDLPIREGGVVEVPMGTMVLSMHPSRRRWIPAGRTYRVRVDHIFPGFDARHDSYGLRKHRQVLTNAMVRWTGSGGILE